MIFQLKYFLRKIFLISILLLFILNCNTGVLIRKDNITLVPQVPQSYVYFSAISNNKDFILTVNRKTLAIWDDNGRLMLSMPTSKLNSSKDHYICDYTKEDREENIKKCGFERNNVIRIIDGNKKIIYIDLEGNILKNINSQLIDKIKKEDFTIVYENDKVKVYKSGALIRSKSGNGEATNAEVSLDGKFLIADFEKNYNFSQTKIWDLSDGSLIKEINRKFIGEYYPTVISSFSPDGSYILVEGENKFPLLIKTEDFSSIAFSTETDNLNNAYFASDGKSVVTVGDKIKRWDVKGNQIATFGSELLNIGSVKTLIPDKSFVVNGFRQNSQIWDSNLKLTNILGEDSECSQAIATSKDGSYIISGSRQGSAKIWNKNGSLLRTIKGNSSLISATSLAAPLIGGYGDCSYDVAISNDSKYIAIADNAQIQIWSITGTFLRLLRSKNPYSHDIISVKFINNNLLVSTDDEGEVEFWDIMSGKVINSHRTKAPRVEVSFDGRSIFAGNTFFNASANVTATIDYEAITSAFSKNSRYLFMCNKSPSCSVWVNDNNMWKEHCQMPLNNSMVTGASFFNEKAIIFSDASGLLSISDYNCSEPLNLVTTIKGSMLIYDPESTTYSVKGDDALGVIYFRNNSKLYSFNQYDMVKNRPDYIFKKYNSLIGRIDDDQTTERYAKYIHFRRRQNSYSPTDSTESKSSIKFTNRFSNFFVSSDISIRTEFSAKSASSLPIIGYKVFVNGVPIHGDYIKRTYPNSDKVINAKEVTIEETIQLSQGENKIEVSAFTEDGVESPRESITFTYNPLTKRKPDLYFVGIGIDEYNLSTSGGLDALKYAVKDSKELEDTFQKAGKGSFGNVYSKVITNKEVTQGSIKTLREFLAKSQVDDHVILFLSGHGIRKDTKVSDLLVAFGDNIPEHYKLRNKSDVDDVYYYMTSEANVDKPWEKGIPLDSIRNLVNGIPSRQKIMFVDTCQSGEKLDLDDKTIASLTKNVEIRKTRGLTAQTRGVKLVTTPGANTKPEEVEKHVLQTIAKSNLQKEMSELFPELRRGTGTIEISAATGAQSALESSEWKNGAFTYVIKEAILKGKAKDKSGNITARSLRKYILDEVENLTDGQQTPMVARDIAGRDFVIFGK